MNCLSCQHWRIVSDYTRKADQKHVLHGACTRARGFSFEPDDKQSKAFAIAGHPESVADLMTDEDFGCVQFEQRTGPVDSYPGWVNESTLDYAKERIL